MLDSVFDDDILQTRRIKRRYDKLQKWYAEQITCLRTGRESILDAKGKLLSFSLRDQEDLGRQLALDINVRWGWDLPLLILKLESNWDFAKNNENKFLLRESLHGFPIMNYTLKEGPYKVSMAAEFGLNDYHVVLQGDDGNLIYFLPDRDGLKQGLYVENLL